MIPARPQPRRRVDEVARVDWPTFLRRFRWAQGEHVSLVGPTGGGKSTLALALLPMREHVVVLATKPADATLEQLRHNDGFRKLSAWPPPRTWPPANRVLLWPRFRRASDQAKQRLVFGQALDDIFASGGWCLYVDELRYVTERLGFSDEMEMFWQQGRSVHLSVVACAQRPAHVPLSMYSQATHLFLWRTNDETDLRRLGGIGFADSKQIRETVARLELHDVLYVNSRTGFLAVTRVTIS